MGKTWDDVPADIKNTFDRLGVPQAERKFLAGVAAQYESEVVYHSLHKELESKGVIFTDTDSALRDHPDLFKEYFGTIIPPGDNKLAALNSAVWSGGSFIYVPKGVKVEIPLQAYFRINAENMGQFERTLIICDEDSFVHYIEGCTAPIYTTDSLHSAVVEIIVKRGARCRYTTVQNWSTNVYNLVTKRAVAYGDATMEWVDGNLGSQITMKYPSIYLMEPGAKGDVLSVAFAGKGQHQDAGGKAVHVAPNTSSNIVSQVDLEERRPHLIPGPGQGLPRRQELEVVRPLRRLAARRPVPVGHVPHHRGGRGAGQDRARGDRQQGVRRAALLPAEPRDHQGRGGDDDRQRVHRAFHQGASDRVRRRAEPVDPARNDGLDWLVGFNRDAVEQLSAQQGEPELAARPAALRLRGL